jgi:hypothetical protein
MNSLIVFLLYLLPTPLFNSIKFEFVALFPSHNKSMPTTGLIPITHTLGLRWKGII